jgi:hypothetical protein
VQPADGEWEGGRHLSLDLAQSIDIDRHDLRFASVGDPEAVIVPSQRLAELQSVEQDRWIRHWSHPLGLRIVNAGVRDVT